MLSSAHLSLAATGPFSHLLDFRNLRRLIAVRHFFNTEDNIQDLGTGNKIDRAIRTWIEELIKAEKGALFEYVVVKVNFDVGKAQHIITTYVFRPAEGEAVARLGCYGSNPTCSYHDEARVLRQAQISLCRHTLCI